MAVFIFVILLFPKVAFTKALSFEKCVQELLNNSELKASEEVVLSKKFTQKKISGGYLPKIMGSWSLQEEGGDFGTKFGDGRRQIYSASVSQNIFSGFLTDANAEEASEDLLAAEIDHKILKARLSASLKETIANFIYSRELQKYTETLVERRKENLKMVELRFLNGRENKGSVLLYQAYLSQAYLDQQKATNYQIFSNNELRRLLGWPIKMPLEFLGELPPSAIQMEINDFQIFLDSVALWQQTLLNIRKSKFLIKKTKALFYPSLDLIGSWGDSINESMEKRSQWIVKLELTIPFFEGGKDYFSLQSSQRLERSLKIKAEDTEKEILNNLQKTYLSMQEARDEYGVSQDFLKAAKTRADIARSKYNNGLISFDDWDNIENDLISKSKGVILSKKTFSVAEAQWEFLLGRSLIP